MRKIPYIWNMNPFLSEYNRIEVDDDGNIINGVLRDAVIGNYEFVKIFTHNSSWLSNLGKSDIVVFQHLINQIESGKDTVEIKYNDVPLSSTAFYDSIKRLEQIKLIKKKSKSVYWINPYKIFSGSRESYIQKVFKMNDNDWSRFKTLSRQK